MRSLLAFFIVLIGFSINAQNINKLEESERIEYKKIDTVSLKLHVFRPENFDKSKTYNCIVFFHGGGWNNGSYKAFKRQSAYLASRGMIAISADYRIKNIHGTTPFEAVEDAKSAIRYVRKHAKELNINPDKIAAGGGSAGGHLAAACGNIEGLEAANEDYTISSKPNALVLFNPVYDNSKNGFGFRRMEGRYLEISPLHNITKGAPPTIVFFGTKDKTTPVSSSKEFKQKMEDVGSRCDLFLYEGAEHSFFNKAPYFTETLKETDRFLISLDYLKGTPIDQINGENLVQDNQIKYATVNPDFAKIAFIENTEDTSPIVEFETLSQPKFIYNCATAIPIKKANYNKGRVFLASFKAKTIKSSLETGEAKLNLLFRQTKNYQDNIVATQSISSNWQTYYIPFQSTVNLTKEEFKLVFHYGFTPQSFQIKNLKFEVFPEGIDISTLPKTLITYKGMEADANWRKSAEARIEKIRKSDFQLQIFKKGKPIINKTLSIALEEHDFQFGAAVVAKQIVENPEYYNNFKNAFNHVVLANALKIKAWRWEQKRPITLKALDMLKEDGYNVKGHVLIWPGFNHLTPVFKEQKDNPEAIIKLMAEHVNTMLDVTKGKVSHWDVVNEAYTNQDLQKITGSEEILYDGFRTLKAKQPNVSSFTNEYGIISKGGLDTKKQQWYYDFVKRIDDNTNGLIDGIGIQCHIGSDLTPPDKVLRLLNYYSTLGKQISISEFTMDIQDLEIREQYTRDFLIAAFSHPNVSEFLFWGFVEDERKKVDIYNKDWTIGAMGKAYFSLVQDKWKTNLVGETNAEGTVNARGFYGKYKYTFVEDGKVVSGTFSLKPNQSKLFKIEL